MSIATEPIPTPEAATLAVGLIRSTNPSIAPESESDRIAISQTHHRLNLLASWFDTLESAKHALQGKTVLEIGCGQGDMTVALAWAVRPTGKVIAIDPAPLDYGSPETLREAQERISKSEIGERIEWVQADPVEVLKRDQKLGDADYIVLAHSLLYMESTQYVTELFRTLAPAASRHEEAVSSPTLLIAEWGMRVSTESARAHLLAVRAQAAQPLDSGNVQLYLEPKVTMELATEAGWKGERETWIESPDLDDGSWEVVAARSMSVDGDTGGAVRKYLDEMDRVASGSVRCMDAWTGVLQ